MEVKPVNFMQEYLLFVNKKLNDSQTTLKQLLKIKIEQLSSNFRTTFEQLSSNFQTTLERLSKIKKNKKLNDFQTTFERLLKIKKIKKNIFQIKKCGDFIEILGSIEK